MNRNIQSIAGQTFDVAIVGGGIHGAAAAWQCAASGLKVVLIERGDFGGLTSANSLKIIHGGFRYLQHLNLKRMRESIISRRIMMQISPENVRSLRCAIPTAGCGLRNKWIMRSALFLNNIISFDRNNGISEDRRIPPGKTLSLKECKKHFPLVDWNGKSGCAVWYDAIALNTERLTLGFIQQAVHLGAEAANYLEMRQIILKDETVKGVVVSDLETGENHNIEAKSLIFAAGPANDRLLGRHQNRKDAQKEWAKAVNIVVKKKLLADTAIGLTGEERFVDRDAVMKKQGRFFFFVPWRGYTMIGTTYSFDANVNGSSVERDDIETILGEVNTIFPNASLSVADVTNVHTGLVPAYGSEDRENEVQLVKETEVTDLAEKRQNPLKGIFTIKSVKYTTAPVVGYEAAQKIGRYLEMKLGDNGISPLFKTSESSPTISAKIAERYGRLSKTVEQYIRKNPTILCDEPLLHDGEVDYFVEEEMARTLEDVVFRRSAIATAECPSREILFRIAERMARHYDWTKDRIAEEVDHVEHKFVWKEKNELPGRYDRFP